MLKFAEVAPHRCEQVTHHACGITDSSLVARNDLYEQCITSGIVAAAATQRHARARVRFYVVGELAAGPEQPRAHVKIAGLQQVAVHSDSVGEGRRGARHICTCVLPRHWLRKEQCRRLLRQGRRTLLLLLLLVRERQRRKTGQRQLPSRRWRPEQACCSWSGQWRS
jgi:hypothetical protein